MKISLPVIGDVEQRVRDIGSGLDATGGYIRNALLHFSGVRQAAVATSPRQLVWSRDKAQLFRYESTQRRHRTPVLLVMSLVTKPTIFDLTPRHSLVRSLLDEGHDVFMLDWGVPDAVDAGNTLETYSDEYLPRAIEQCMQVAGSSDVALFGYCMGGVLAILTAAAHPELPIESMVLLATPVDFLELGPGVRMIARGRVSVDDLVDVTGNVPPDALVAGFKLVQPAVDIATYNSLWHSFFDERSLYAHQAIVGWSQGQIPFPGATMRQISDQFLEQGELANGKVTLAGGTIDLASLTMPILIMTGTKDKFVPEAASSPLPGLLSGAEVKTLEFETGHVGLLHGRTAVKHGVPEICAWFAGERTTTTS